MLRLIIVLILVLGREGKTRQHHAEGRHRKNPSPHRRPQNCSQHKILPEYSSTKYPHPCRASLHRPERSSTPCLPVPPKRCADRSVCQPSARYRSRRCLRTSTHPILCAPH